MVDDDLEPDDALARVLAACAPLPPERCDLLAAHGRVLAAPLHARHSLPGADVSTMDGWAVRAADLSSGTSTCELVIAGESAAGHPSPAALGPGQAARISTGAVLPPGADAVVAQEDTTRAGDRLRVDLTRAGALAPGHFVRRAGSDLLAGAEILAPGALLRAGDLALAAGAGHDSVLVHRAPRVTILSSGDELVPIGCPPGHGQVVSSNGLMLTCQARAAGALVRDLGIVRDDPEALKAALAAAAADADVVLVSGGISVGDHDLVWPTLLALGAAPLFRRVRMRPGRPLALARLGDALVFALPGNPASSFVAFELFARPALRRLAGHPHASRPRRRFPLAAPAQGDRRRTHFVRAALTDGRAQPLPSQLSGALTSLRGCDLLVIVPPGPGLPAGADAEALVLADEHGFEYMSL